MLPVQVTLELQIHIFNRKPPPGCSTTDYNWTSAEVRPHLSAELAFPLEGLYVTIRPAVRPGAGERSFLDPRFLPDPDLLLSSWSVTGLFESVAWCLSSFGENLQPLSLQTPSAPFSCSSLWNSGETISFLPTDLFIFPTSCCVLRGRLLPHLSAQWVASDLQIYLIFC